MTGGNGASPDPRLVLVARALRWWFRARNMEQIPPAFGAEICALLDKAIDEEASDIHRTTEPPVSQVRASLGQAPCL